MSTKNDQGDSGQPPESAQPARSPLSYEEWLRPGMTLNARYSIERELGRGGIGVVYLARDRKVASRLVVIKVLQQKAEWLSVGAYLKRKFRQELEALARIRHHGVVGIHDADETPEGRLFLVMEFVEGVTLRSELDDLRSRRAEGMEFDRVGYIVRALGQALSHAHREKVIHRDLKPENIMLHRAGDDDEQVKIIDFGISTVKDSHAAADKMTTMVAGTLAYMAPEQLLGKPEAASDTYALGVIAYEMLTGRVPFMSVAAARHYELQQNGMLAMPRAFRPDLPEAAEAVLLQTLSFNPEERPARARDFGVELALALTALPNTTTARPEPLRPPRTADSEAVTEVSADSRQPTAGRQATSAPATPASPPPADRILTQILGVSHRQGVRGNENLIYALAPLGMEEEAPPWAFVRVKGQVLKQHIERVREQVEDLIRRAALNHPHESSGFEAAANELASHVLPKCGLVGMLGAGVHPQFDIIPDVASEIPWEALEEVYPSCLKCQIFLPPHQTPESKAPYCGNCGETMVWAGNKLALTHHLSHLVRGPGWAAAEGDQFLIIQNPTGDLCGYDKESGRTCARHMEEVQALLQKQGYRVNLIKENSATVDHVLRAIQDNSVVGIYYFGHGFFPRDGDEGMLLLADGPLYASQVEEIRPKARFVFLNACEGAASGRDWDIEQRSRSVAEAFARGGRGRVVIAPLWPMVSVQAAETALEFFRHATADTPAGVALRHARDMSLCRYKSGEAHIAWMAYRYFGDPNRPLPPPAVTAGIAGPGLEEFKTSRVFVNNGQLDTEVFSFAIDEVILRAVKRRNRQGRAQVTVTDFVAGLIRKGTLMRFVLKRCGAEADRLYEKVCKQPEDGPSVNQQTVSGRVPFGDGQGPAGDDSAPGTPLENMDEVALRALLAKWIVRDREQFDARLIALLERADETSRRPGGQNEGRQICEQHLLEELVSDPEWARLFTCGLPPAEDVRRVLGEREQEGQIDKNGVIRLEGLDEGARRIIETAHILAQQRGICPITNRLLLAAFLADKNGFAVRVCARAGVHRKLLFALMITASKKNPPRSFGLGMEACERIIMPVLKEARAAAPDSSLITERELFRAFCDRAGAGLKDFLKLPALATDLDKLKLINPDLPPSERPVEELLPLLDRRARRVLARAYLTACELEAVRVPNRLLLAAFLCDPRGCAAPVLERRRLPAALLCAELVKSFGGEAEDFTPLDDETAQAVEFDPERLSGVVTDMIRRAAASAGDMNMLTEPRLFKAFCEVTSLKRPLKRSRLKLDLDELAAEVDANSHGCGDESRFEPRAWQAITEAARLAWGQGWTEIRTPHLFAGLIGDGAGPAGLALRQRQLNPEVVKRQVLSRVRPRLPSPDATPEIKLGNHARQVIAHAARLAASAGRERVSEEDIYGAFWDGGAGVVGETLRRLGALTPPHATRNVHEQTGGGGPMLSKDGDDASRIRITLADSAAKSEQTSGGGRK